MWIPLYLLPDIDEKYLILEHESDQINDRTHTLTHTYTHHSWSTDLEKKRTKTFLRV